MWNSAKVATTTAITISALMMVICVTVVCRMRSDISELYNEFMIDMKEFNTLTNDAWTTMLEMEKQAANSFEQNQNSDHKIVVRKNDIEQFNSFFARSSRAANGLPAFCTCSSMPNRVCPPGPKGPAGKPGASGQPGAPGTPGQIGLTGMALGDALYKQECIQCPAGEPGKPGSPGRAGVPGPRGEDGSSGEARQIGAKGPPGPPGDEGEGGHDGEPGERGPPGEPGTSGKLGAPGPKGAPGEAGEPGANGDMGTPGTDGASGEMGRPGDVGLPGIPGPRGPPGQDGGLGFPGQDAQYCPCPHRAAVIEAASQKGKEYTDPAGAVASATRRRFIVA